MVIQTLEFPKTIVPPGSMRELKLTLDPALGFVFPIQIIIPKECRPAMKVAGFRAFNTPDGWKVADEVPFLIRHFHGELFDGNETRDIPYGRLPRVRIDAGSVITLEAFNDSLMPVTFKALLTVEHSPKSS